MWFTDSQRAGGTVLLRSVLPLERRQSRPQLCVPLSTPFQNSTLFARAKRRAAGKRIFRLTPRVRRRSAALIVERFNIRAAPDRSSNDSDLLSIRDNSMPMTAREATCSGVVPRGEGVLSRVEMVDNCCRARPVPALRHQRHGRHALVQRCMVLCVPAPRPESLAMALLPVFSSWGSLFSGHRGPSSPPSLWGGAEAPHREGLVIPRCKHSSIT